MAGRKKKKILRVGVIGCGRIADVHLRAAYEAEGVKLVACCDVIKERARATAAEYGIRAYTDFRKMIRRKRLHAVHICLPPYLHSVVANYCFLKKVHVISELPMAIDPENAESAVRFAELTGVQYGVILQYRYNAPTLFVKEALASGKLGRILSARSVLTWSRPDSYYEECSWRGTWEKAGGGVVISEAIHEIDLVNWLVGSEVDTVSCTMTNRAHSSHFVEDSAEGLITYKNGVRYGFYCMNNYESDAPAEIHLACEHGEVTFGHRGAVIRYHDGRITEMNEKDAAIYGYRGYRGSRHAAQIHQFYRACRGEEELEVSGRAALATHRLIYALYEEAERRGIHLFGREEPEAPAKSLHEGERIWYY